jgi:hypothetical protein
MRRSQLPELLLRVSGVCAAACAWLLLVAAPAIAQVPTAATVSGLVIDAATGQRLEGAYVSIEPLPQGLVAAANGTLSASRVIITAADGAYRFSGIAPGRYRLRVQRIGYRAAILEADVRRPMDARISVGLELQPIALRAVQVEQQAAPTFRRVSGHPLEPETARGALERYRQELFLTPDSRALTMADVVEGITFGEGDVFRALQRFPGVATRDDYTAELWTRGAPWAQTRVTFDGLPLFNPVHAVGVFSAVTPDILGGVFFHPGVRSVALGEGAAGAVDLRSRPGDGAGDVDGAVDVSMASAKLTLDQSLAHGRAAWILSARRSYLDFLTGGLDWVGLRDIELPYSFHDVSGRVDVQLGAHAALEASGIWEDDRLYGDVEDVLERTTARWGNTLARVTLHTPIAGWAAQHTLGFSRYRADIRQHDSIPGRDEPWVEPPGQNRIVYVRLASEFHTQSADDRARWALGYDVVTQDARYDGPEPRYYPLKPDTAVRLFGEGVLWNVGAWAEARYRITDRLQIAPGARVELGTRILHSGLLRVAPRLSARYTLDDGHNISFAAGRSWQYLQALALAGPSAHPAFHAGQFWLWAGDDAPALRSDIITLGTEHWSGAWLGSITAFHRHTTGVGLPDPHPGRLGGRPLFVVGENTAQGVELALRRVTGPFLMAVAYTFSISDIDAAGFTFPASTDRRHRADASAGIALPAGFRIGFAATAMTGAPFTRVQARITESDCSLFGFECSPRDAAIGEPNAQRTPGYASLDATVQWAEQLGGLEVSAYLQMRNVTDRNNASTYAISFPHASRTAARSVIAWQDHFERGLPRMPLVGVRIAF